MAVPGRLIDVGGHRLHVVSAGDGRPRSLLQSGIAASSLSWAVVQPAIAGFTRVHAYDRAGLGWSDVPSRPRTFDRIVEELRMLLAEVAPRERCILVGHSFGSFVVRGFAMRHPDLVASLVLVDPAMEWLTPTPEHAYRLRRANSNLSRIGARISARPGRRSRQPGIAGRRESAVLWCVAGLFGSTWCRARSIGSWTEVRKLPPSTYAFDGGDLVTAEVLSRDGRSPADAGTGWSSDRTPRRAARDPHCRDLGRQSAARAAAAHRVLADVSNAGRHVIAARSAHWIQFDEPELIIDAVRDLVESCRRT